MASPRLMIRRQDSTTRCCYAGLGRYIKSILTGASEAETVRTMESTIERLGEREQTGSVAEASPARRSAWQRQPPKSCVRRSQDLHGSCIQDSPRNFWNASLEFQISRSDSSFTFSKRKPGMTAAA